MILQVMRFFRAADPMPGWLALLTIGVGLYAIGIATVNPAQVDEGLAMLLLWQMFSASTGFVRRASAGHFDVALVKWPRTIVAAAHALHSISLVPLLWLIVGVTELARGQQTPAAFEPGRLAALVFVSTTSWAIALPAARFVTGSLWLVLIVAAVTTQFGLDQYTQMLARPNGSLWQGLHAVALTLICPFLLIGEHIPPRGAVASGLFVAALLLLAAGMAYIRRRDYPLEAAL